MTVPRLQALRSVGTHGRVCNVLEGNHALKLAATYRLHSYLNPLLTLTADYRDATLAGVMRPSQSSDRNCWHYFEPASKAP